MIQIKVLLALVERINEILNLIDHDIEKNKESSSMNKLYYNYRLLRVEPN
jgi:hypothetical protein